MTHKDRVALCGRIGLILASLILIGRIVAELLLRLLRFPHLAVAQR